VRSPLRRTVPPLRCDLLEPATCTPVPDNGGPDTGARRAAQHGTRATRAPRKAEGEGARKACQLARTLVLVGTPVNGGGVRRAAGHGRPAAHAPRVPRLESYVSSFGFSYAREGRVGPRENARYRLTENAGRGWRIEDGPLNMPKPLKGARLLSDLFVADRARRGSRQPPDRHGILQGPTPWRSRQIAGCRGPVFEGGTLAVAMIWGLQQVAV
jgi:hypothetical protein